MKREYVRGNREHWKEVYEWACGEKLKEDVEAGLDAGGSCFGCDMCIFLNEVEDKPFIIDAENKNDKALYDVVTTNPHWHEVKPWEDKPYEPKPFDKVVGWDYDKDVVWPDIFLYKSFDTYICAKGRFKHVKPYNEEEYLK